MAILEEGDISGTMAKVKVITDTTCCLPPEMVSQYGLTLVPVGLVIDKTYYRDCVDIDLKRFCELLPTFTKQPSTSAISPGDFVSTFQELGKTTDNIVCILVSKSQSATQESAFLARRLLRAENPRLNVEIVDSKTSCGALGFLAMEAARLAETGASLAEVVKQTNAMASTVVYLSAPDTLKYLINMGRIAGGASLGESLDVKPVVGIVDDTGRPEVLARIRGKQKALEKVVDLIGKYVDAKKPLRAMVHYSVSREDAEQLKDMIMKRYRCKEMYVTPFTPVTVCSTGPMVGVGFCSEL